MDGIANQIKNRLSLRPPQRESLDILVNILNNFELKKNPKLQVELEKIKKLYPTCTDFERDFPSICFALATGVGKTRLMGAFITYLTLTKKSKNFFVLAPNLTIYNKLMEDFSNPNHPKYVFKGIGEFVHNRPRVITGETYHHVGDLLEKKNNNSININVFNISKINAETRSGAVPRIKRLSEYLGDSYFSYLSNLDDLVLLMDESHHYRADRGMQVINELKPLLGLELTATPQVERSNTAIKFKNVVYEYSLAKAIRDGFVKEPAVATRKDFDPSHYSAEELDRIKLEDGVRIHEDTKVALDIFARDSKMNQVKPFVLVVAKDTDHASQLKEMIMSAGFFEGRYADKVMEIHSNQRGEEKDENIAQLLSLEHPDNKIEIVIHVNMLKEGWDVTNLYTIIPLRTAASTTLREQTIGRGLRLPYGIRTGSNKVDKLTIIAHDKFQEIIDAANQPDSIIKRENIIVIDPAEISKEKEVVTSSSNMDAIIKEEQKRIEEIENPEEKQKAKTNLEVKKLIHSTLNELNTKVKTVEELTSTEIKEIAIQNIKDKIQKDPQQILFAEEMIKEAEESYETEVEAFRQNIIEIPRIIIQQCEKIVHGFHDFDLDTKNLNFQPVSEEILVKTLRAQENDIDYVIGKGRIINDSLENIIVNELINCPEIDYDDQADLLFKLAGQSVAKFKSYLNKDEVYNVVQFHKREIASFIYAQMKPQFYCEAPKFEKPKVYPFVRIEEHNFSKDKTDVIHHFKDTITPTNSIPSKIFSGFGKACHRLYKFDSKTEKDFAIILEQENNDVIKWMRPAPNQFNIYWEHNSKRYYPDFVSETTSTIYLIETKKADDLDSAEVKEKARAALEYCKYATDFNLENGGKPWKYILIPHNAVMHNMSFDMLVRRYDII